MAELKITDPSASRDLLASRLGVAGLVVGIGLAVVGYLICENLPPESRPRTSCGDGAPGIKVRGPTALQMVISDYAAPPLLHH